MNVLMSTADERDLTEFLSLELGAKLLLSDIAPFGVPQVAADPLAALPRELPHQASPGCPDIYEILFWLPTCGPITTLRDAEEPEDARDRVADLLTRESAEGRFQHVIDQRRTPLLVVRRTTQHAVNRLAPGLISSTRIHARSLPPPIRSYLSRAQRWLKKRGTKVDPFCYCPDVATRRPARLGPYWVWVQPHAMQLVAQGMEIWPWNA